MVDVVVLSEAQDQLVWKWMPSGTYTARSAYLATFQGSMPCPAWKHTWKAWAPPRVKLFHWLAYQNRCWTADRLANRGLQHHARCLLCDQEPETMRHLLIECSFTKQIWHEALAWLRIPCRPPEDADTSIFAWLDSTKRATPKPLRKGLGSAAWNKCVFERGRPSVPDLLRDIQCEAKLWAQAGATGLGVVLPTTWDVH
jgi:hypothetical protein